MVRRDQGINLRRRFVPKGRGCVGVPDDPVYKRRKSMMESADGKESAGVRKPINSGDGIGPAPAYPQLRRKRISLSAGLAPGDENAARQAKPPRSCPHAAYPHFFHAIVPRHG